MKKHSTRLQHILTAQRKVQKWKYLPAVPTIKAKVISSSPLFSWRKILSILLCARKFSDRFSPCIYMMTTSSKKPSALSTKPECTHLQDPSFHRTAMPSILLHAGSCMQQEIFTSTTNAQAPL